MCARIYLQYFVCGMKKKGGGIDVIEWMQMPYVVCTVRVCLRAMNLPDV